MDHFPCVMAPAAPPCLDRKQTFADAFVFSLIHALLPSPPQSVSRFTIAA